MAATVLVGLDVGSTTVKAVAVHPDTRVVIWRDYRRHHTRQAQAACEMLERIVRDHGRGAAMRVAVTGSGAGPLREPLRARFVQEVNAVTVAVERLHPAAGSVVELGGQDAKIIVFRDDPAGGRRSIASMNDKCASGTGATVDKCLLKIGIDPDVLAGVRFDASRLHHVAAKCGVFAETDVVNLLKSGIAPLEILCSLADAIVAQNLAVLTRGQTLRHQVLLLGGPNAYLPFLRECWRLRIRETWDERGHAYPRDVPPEALVFAPPDAEYFAAHGAVLQGLTSAHDAPDLPGLDALRAFIDGGRQRRLGGSAGPPLAASAAELDDFRRRFPPPRFDAPRFALGETVHAALGIDGGSTSSKCVLVDGHGNVLRKEYQLSGGNPIADVQQMLARLEDSVACDGATLAITALGVTGYAGEVLARALRADVDLVETVAHAASAVHALGPADVVCDIGGQDIKVLRLRDGQVHDFRLSNQCSAGNGMLLQVMADQFGLPITDYAETAFRAGISPRFGYGCAVFLDSDRVNFQRQGFTREELLAGLARVLPKNVWQYVAQTPRLAELGTRFVLQGGTQHNLAALKAQVDYIEARVPGADVRVHPHAGEAGAVGAALEAARVVAARGRSRFVGLAAALGLVHEARNDASTRCGFCANACSRTFVDIALPDGGRARHITGFSCEKGTVEDLAAVKRMNRQRRERAERFPNLVALEASLCFRRFHEPAPLPASGTPVADVSVRRGPMGGVRRRMRRRGFRRSDDASAARRAGLRIAMPRVLNHWSTAPFFRAYFETLGIAPRNLVFSSETSEALWQAGGKYGAIDPCHPAKVCQAHVHELLFEQHPKRALHYLFFPCITHLPTFVEGCVDNTTCPVVAGTPKVVRAAFTRESDRFAARGIDYVDPALTFDEPVLLAHQLFEAWAERLGVTEDESDFAVAQGEAALAELDRRLQARGRELLERVEAEGRIAVLVLARPYHHDPGLGHGIPEELQALGYPVLSIRSLPKDPAWLERFFADDRARGHLESPLEIDDVWPESYSVNSVQKVWAARFAARHPNLAVLDLSSFKCGHDAPTYGLVDRILGSAGTPCLTLHDLDANRPAGSIRIRVRTFAHTLERYREGLARRRADASPPAWSEQVHDRFRAAERAHTTLLLGGLTLAHDRLAQAALAGLGYRVRALDVADNDALQLGKEFGNRGQCNPTYFTVGNLIKHLVALRDRGMPHEEIVARHVFVTAGACGPCRFGTYVTEYRKALRDAGFEGFRVLLFQQTGGLRQATGDDAGLVLGSAFFASLLKAFVAGDVLNALGYRIRPYETDAGATDAALARCHGIVADALERRRMLVPALWRCRRLLAAVPVDRLRVRPKVSLIGEFWAMTTEGDGNYRLQRFLEEQGAEVEVQFLTAWLLYLLWQGRHDTRRRAGLRGADAGRFGLRGVNVARRLATLGLAERALRIVFHVAARSAGLRGATLPDMDELARVSHAFYDNALRGGEGHMEVGKLILNVVHRKVNMTVSVKPFGCMPSSGVSDGVQALVTELYPEGIFLPVETTGDGAVNALSRVEMQLHKARGAAEAEVRAALEVSGLTLERVRAFLSARPGTGAALHDSPHRDACRTADLVHEVADRLRPLRWLRGRRRTRRRALSAAASTAAAGLRGRAACAAPRTAGVPVTLRLELPVRGE